MSIGENVKVRRKAQGMTQQELADKLFVTQQTVQKWEAGLCEPGPDKWSDLTNVLHISMMELIDDSVLSQEDPSSSERMEKIFAMQRTKNMTAKMLNIRNAEDAKNATQNVLDDIRTACHIDKHFSATAEESVVNEMGFAIVVPIILLSLSVKQICGQGNQGENVFSQYSRGLGITFRTNAGNLMYVVKSINIPNMIRFLESYGSIPEEYRKIFDDTKLIYEDAIYRRIFEKLLERTYLHLYDDWKEIPT